MALLTDRANCDIHRTTNPSPKDVMVRNVTFTARRPFVPLSFAGMHLADRTLGLGGLRIAYRDSDPTADADVPVTVLVHGLSADSRSWEPTIDRLVAQGQRVIAPDMRGHGQTARAPRYLLDDFVADLNAVTDAVVPDRQVDMIGHSFGGMVAALCAASADRQRVRRLVLEDIPLPPRWDGPTELPTLKRRESLLHGLFFLLRNPRGAWNFDRSQISAVRGAIQARNPQWWSAVSQLPVPVLVVDGGVKGMMDRTRLDDLRSTIPDVRVVSIPVGHVVHRADPERFAAALGSFLN